MRTTLQIDDDVLDTVRLIAQREGTNVGAVLSDLARRMLRPSRIQFDGTFPVFEVPDAAPPITPDNVARVVAEE